MQKSINYISDIIDSFSTFFINDSKMKNTNKSEKIKIKVKKLKNKTKNNKSKKNKTKINKNKLRNTKTKKNVDKNTSSSSLGTISNNTKKYKKVPSFKDFTNYKSDSDESGYKIGDFKSPKI